MRVVIISVNLRAALARLQPYRTILEIGRVIKQQGHDVVFISDGAPDAPRKEDVMGLQITHIENIRIFRGSKNTDLVDAVSACRPDIILWHLGIVSFVHQQLINVFDVPTIGVVSSPAHTFRDILRSFRKLVDSNIDVGITHLAAAMVPAPFIQNSLQEKGLDGLITFSEATRQTLINRGSPPERTWVVPPGIDEDWLHIQTTPDELKELRSKLGFDDNDFVVVYFGSPAPVRGIFTLIEAVKKLSKEYPRIRVLALSRRSSNKWVRESNRLGHMAATDEYKNLIHIVDGFLERPDLINHIASSDAVCLPFEILPSDVPLSVLEAMATGTPVITTCVASLPELAGDGRGLLVDPGSVNSIIKCLRSLLANPESVLKQRQLAREHIETNRTWSHMGTIIERIVLDVTT